MSEEVIVVGSGVAGLAAAWQLARDGMNVHVYERDQVVGGKVRSSTFAGRVVDEASDAFLARVPHGVELARELGIADQLIAPTARRAHVWSNGLWPLPEPNVLGIPLEPATVEALLGTEAARALQADLDRTSPNPVRDDDTIGSLVRRRVGDRVHEALVDPLIGAINAGNTDELSLAASSPQILAAASAGPSLVRALRAMTPERSADTPVFHSFAGGMRVLIEALERSLEGRITTGVGVQAVEPLSDATLRVSLSTGGWVGVDAVILACPPRAAAEITEAWPTASRDLAAIPLVSVTLVTLAYPVGTLDPSSVGGFSGFVVPRSDPSLRITACSYASQKWPHLGGDVELLRVSVGHGQDQVTPALDDDALMDVVLADVATTLGIKTPPLATRISRWPDAFPQYVVGHLDRLARIEAELNPDGVFVAGMGYRGIGVPACIDQGRTAAVEAILHILDRRG